MSVTEIVREIMENGRAADQTELENEFLWTASEDGWTDERIKRAIADPLFPQIT